MIVEAARRARRRRRQAEYLPEARWQRCMVHFYRNVFSHVPATKVREVSHILKPIHAQESRDAADRKARAIVDDLRTAKMNTAADLVERSVSETLAYYAFPAARITLIVALDAAPREIGSTPPMLPRSSRHSMHKAGVEGDGDPIAILLVGVNPMAQIRRKNQQHPGFGLPRDRAGKAICPIDGDGEHARIEKLDVATVRRRARRHGYVVGAGPYPSRMVVRGIKGALAADVDPTYGLGFNGLGIERWYDLQCCLLDGVEYRRAEFATAWFGASKEIVLRVPAVFVTASDTRRLSPHRGNFCGQRAVELSRPGNLKRQEWRKKEGI